MRANDLRIGNWVKGNAPFQITGNNIALYEAREKAKEKGILKGQQLPEPIELTEDWLVKFGFKTYSSEGRFIITPNDEIELLITLEEDSENRYCHIDLFQQIDKNDDEGVEFIFLTKVDYNVHQLQNLYFALTNTELCVQTDK